MKKRIWRVARWFVYPLFYLSCLLLFGYLTFPFDALKHRIVAEFDRAQQRSLRRAGPGASPMRLEIGELDGYWLTGVEVENAKLTIPPQPAKKKRGKLAMLSAASSSEPQKDSVIVIEHATARLQLLPLLLGRVRINFDAKALGGTVAGSVPYGDSGDAEVTLEGLQLGQVEPLAAMLQGIPISGVANGSVSLSPKEGKFAKADGKLSVRIEDVILGQPGKNGKLEVQGTKLPSPSLGVIVLEAVAKDGLLSIEEMSSTGRDAELIGDGKVKLHESWKRSTADIFVKFRFTDVYRNSDPAVQGLLGKPGDKFPPAIEVAPGSPFPKAKTEDGFYRFHSHGPLSKLANDPAGSKATKKGSSRTKKKSRLGRSTPRGIGNMLGGGPRSKKPTVAKGKNDGAEEKGADKDEEQ